MHFVHAFFALGRTAGRRNAHRIVFSKPEGRKPFEKTYREEKYYKKS
jgi:hypothetical protein